MSKSIQHFVFCPFLLVEKSKIMQNPVTWSLGFLNMPIYGICDILSCLDSNLPSESELKKYWLVFAIFHDLKKEDPDLVCSLEVPQHISWNKMVDQWVPVQHLVQIDFTDPCFYVFHKTGCSVLRAKWTLPYIYWVPFDWNLILCRHTVDIFINFAKCYMVLLPSL